MNRKIETGLIVVREDIFTKIRKNIFSVIFSKEAILLDMLSEIEKPKNIITGKIVIPKEIKRYWNLFTFDNYTFLVYRDIQRYLQIL